MWLRLHSAEANKHACVTGHVAVTVMCPHSRHPDNMTCCLLEHQRLSPFAVSEPKHAVLLFLPEETALLLALIRTRMFTALSRSSPIGGSVTSATRHPAAASAPTSACTFSAYASSVKAAWRCRPLARTANARCCACTSRCMLSASCPCGAKGKGTFAWSALVQSHDMPEFAHPCRQFRDAWQTHLATAEVALKDSPHPRHSTIVARPRGQRGQNWQ